ncbi:prolyl oligopeptidase family serine peptidase [Actinomyces sp.]|uniref:prolyl oligopeptidase family serine peptidase n=1 Tax=Actinomyces sp. TaxID=29317 RepID=UPI0026DCE481|nr:prolyl oligopeptidase family serine peptidase [Actinomyces sp.]MDO4901720.1 prolyl oligopeptidase family serine peptidase [Actinomyces sp.]
MDRTDAAQAPDTAPVDDSPPNAAPADASPPDAPSLPPVPEWLYEPTGERALAWAAARTDETMSAFTDDVDYLRLTAALQEILEAPDRLPAVTEAAGMVYNFWTDAAHPRGVWRRTTWASYASGAPSRPPRPDDGAATDWEVLLDLDAERRRRGLDLSWAGAQVLQTGPLAGRRALVSLSEGGSDATVTEEFDLEKRRFLTPAEGGFHKPTSKGTLAWGTDGDTCLLSDDFGAGSLSPAGLPRQARRLRRGQAAQDAEVLITAAPHAVLTRVSCDAWGRTWLMSMGGLGDTRVWWLPDDAVMPAGQNAARRALAADEEIVPTDAVLIEAPPSASVGVGRDWVTIQLREPWEMAGHRYEPGMLLGAPLAEWLNGERDGLEVLFAPTSSSFLSAATWTRHHLVLTVLDDVAVRLEVCTPPSRPESGEHAVDRGQWRHHWIDLTGAAYRPSEAEADAAPDPTELRPGRPLLEVTAQAVRQRDTDYLFISASGWTTPPTLTLARLTEVGEVTGMSVLRQAPTRFDASGVRVSQHVAVSADGTRVPYFQIGRPRSGADTGEGGTAPGPTLLYGYGAFGTSQTPCYQPLTGKAWLERGGTYVVACTRGGGEYGPGWHLAGTGRERHRVVEDFAAVARSLIDRGATTPGQLIVHGGSAGGLLVGEMFTLHPELIGGAIAEAPLLDLERYTRLLTGAMWRSEFGDPDDPDDWETMRPLSPFHALVPGREYPPLLLLTSTADDRVHPAHARTMAYRMRALGLAVSYVEQSEGGHAGTAVSAQRAATSALIHTFARRAATR